MTPILRVKPGVRLGGLQPQMAIVLQIVPIVFARKGYDCWLTCAVEPRESGLHPKGLALDFDSSTNVPMNTGQSIAKDVKGFLGGKLSEFDALWHGPRWHLHVEFDPEWQQDTTKKA